VIRLADIDPWRGGRLLKALPCCKRALADAPVGRLIALFWVFVGIVYLTYFTAGLTAEITLQELRSSIDGLEDLQNRPVPWWPMIL